MSNLTLNILTFPLWWYTTGTGVVWQWVKKQYLYGLHSTGLLLFSKHLGEPLYGDYTKAGIVIGFFLRLVLLAYKLLVFGIRLVIVFSFLLLYFLLLPACVLMVIYELMPQ